MSVPPDVDIFSIDDFLIQDETNLWYSKIEQELGLDYILAKPEYVSYQYWYNYWVTYPYIEDIIALTLNLTLEQAYLRRITWLGSIQIGSEIFADMNILFPRAISASKEIYSYFSKLLPRSNYRFYNYVDSIKNLLLINEDATSLLQDLAKNTSLTNYQYNLDKISFILAQADKDDYFKIFLQSIPVRDTLEYSYYARRGYCKGLISILNPLALIEYDRLKAMRALGQTRISLIKTAIKYDNWIFFDYILEMIKEQKLVNDTVNLLIRYAKAENVAIYFPQITLSTGQVFTDLVNKTQVYQALVYAKSKKNKLFNRGMALTESLRTCSSDVLELVKKNTGIIKHKNILIKFCTVNQIKDIIKIISKSDLLLITLSAALKGNTDVVPILIDQLEDDLLNLFQILCYTDLIDIAIYTAIVYRNKYGEFPSIAPPNYNIIYLLSRSVQRKISVLNQRIIYIIGRLAVGDDRNFFDLSISYYN